MVDQEIIHLVDGKRFITCAAIHSGPCIQYWLSEARRAVFLALKTYLPLYGISMLIRFKQLIAKPKSALKGFLKNCVRSSLMVGVMACIAKIGICGMLWIQNGRVTPRLLTVSSFFAAHCTLIESPARVSEMSMYLMPRFFEAIGKFMARRNLPHSIPEVLVFAAGVSAILYSCKYEPCLLYTSDAADE